METELLIRRLSENAETIHALFAGIQENEARWKPEPQRWSLLEVLCHLRDEEREDFRSCLETILHHPGEPWPKIDPMGWVESRAYNTEDRLKVLAEFRREREKSLEWLRGEAPIDPEADHQGHRPFDRRMSAGDVMLSWVAHDLVHMRQILILRKEYLEASNQAYSARYAGEL